MQDSARKQTLPETPAAEHNTVLILDFGSQVTQLIARRIREAGVYSVLKPFNAPVADLLALTPISAFRPRRWRT